MVESRYLRTRFDGFVSQIKREIGDKLEAAIKDSRSDPQLDEKYRNFNELNNEVPEEKRKRLFICDQTAKRVKEEEIPFDIFKAAQILSNTLEQLRIGNSPEQLAAMRECIATFAYADLRWLKRYQGPKLTFWRLDFTGANVALDKNDDLYIFLDCTGWEKLLNQERSEEYAA